MRFLVQFSVVGCLSVRGHSYLDGFGFMALDLDPHNIQYLHRPTNFAVQSPCCSHLLPKYSSKTYSNPLIIQVTYSYPSCQRSSATLGLLRPQEETSAFHL